MVTEVVALAVFLSDNVPQNSRIFLTRALGSTPRILLMSFGLPCSPALNSSSCFYGAWPVWERCHPPSCKPS